MNAYVSKPIRRVELVATLHNLLANREAKASAAAKTARRGGSGVEPTGSVSATLSQALSSSAVSEAVAMAATTALSSNPSAL